MQEVYDKYMEQAKMWWDCLVRDVGADPQGRVSKDFYHSFFSSIKYGGRSRIDSDLMMHYSLPN